MRVGMMTVAAGAVAFGLAATFAAAAEAGKKATDLFVRVSPRDARYFELSDGRPYVPIGLNMVTPGSGGMPQMTRWIENLSANRGNFCRIWLSSPYFDIEHTRSGQYDEQKARRIDGLLALARKRGVRLKLCMEHFRRLSGSPQWSVKALHHVDNGGPAQSIADFLDGSRSRRQFERKIAFYARRYRSDPIVFGWELWNEVDCVAGGDWARWSELMLAELHRRFPKNLAMQSLGSFDTAGKRKRYQRLAKMKGNDVAQVHRYLDLGGRLDVCHGPVDVLAADAVREILRVQPARPVLLAESGAVEKSHTGPFKLYRKDTNGIILHDVLFAPFFAGAAGPGHIWHWGVYVDRMKLWHHFGRFAEAIDGLDPPSEALEPIELNHEQLRVYALKGKRTFLAWCRDTKSDWRTELAEGKPPEPVRGAGIDVGKYAAGLGDAPVRVYDPWQNAWTKAAVTDGKIVLPTFTRSIVVRVEQKGG